MCLGLETDGYSTESAPNSPKKIHQVSQSDNPTKITIKMTTLESDKSGAMSSTTSQSGASTSASAAGDAQKPSRKRRPKEFQSPNSEARILVVENDGVKTSSAHENAPSGANVTLPNEKGNVTISFDANTKKLWQDLHYPYGNYTSFFRHLILLEKYWRNGDLVLADGASPKAAVYVKSVRNRIDGYEGKQRLRSNYDLSEQTRPDLQVPAPELFHTSANVTSVTSVDTAEEEIDDDEDDETVNPNILKIPKVSMPSGSNESPLLSGALNLPTKIRVRTDLMHLGLLAKGEEEGKRAATITPITTTPKPPPAKKKETSPSTFNIADLVASSKKPSSAAPTSNLLQLLNEPVASGSNAAATSGGPHLGNTSLVGMKKKQQTPPHQDSSSAIPLTFNNSIAEVLANANKSKNASATSTPKADVTITKKTPSSSGSTPSNVVQKSAKNFINSSSTKNINSSTGVSNISQLHPLMDMSKLLQKQTPGVAPHIVAQSATSIAPMSASTPTLPSNVRPVQLNKSSSSSSGSTPQPPQGIQTVNKKSLNTVLNRLSGIKSTASTSTTPTKSTTSVKSSPTSTNSSLLQQLQSPPMNKSKQQQQQQKLQQQQQQQQAALLNPFMAAAGFGAIGQPMVQYPWAASLNQASINQQAALAASLMAGLPSTGHGAQAAANMNQAQAAAAMQELMNLSMGGAQQQQQQQQQNASRIRAPPPLTHMGGPRGLGPQGKKDL